MNVKMLIVTGKFSLENQVFVERLHVLLIVLYLVPRSTWLIRTRNI